MSSSGLEAPWVWVSVLILLALGAVAYRSSLQAWRRRAAHLALRVAELEQGMIGAMNDVSERRQAETALREARTLLEKAAAEWELTFDSMDAPTWIVDAEGRMVRFNRAAREIATTCFYEEMPGRTLREMSTGEPWQKAGEMAAQVARSRAVVQGQVRDVASGRTWDLTAGPAEGPTGDERVIVAARDVTRTLELQDSLRRSENVSALGMLVAGVAHEVRNPLFSISANLDAFEAGGVKAEDTAQVMSIIRVEVERLNALMRDLLEYGKPIEALRPRAIEAVVAEALDRCARLAARGRVELRNHVGAGFPPVLMDHHRLAQVFQNLVQNAIQHSPVGGAVSVGAVGDDDDRGGWIVITVRDAGPGFAAADLPHVFEPFFTRRRGGTGLGLAIVQRTIVEHGGTITAANETRGGARIVVRLPCPPALEAVAAGRIEWGGRQLQGEKEGS